MNISQIGGKAAGLDEIACFANVKPRIVIEVGAIESALIHGALPQAAKDRIACLSPHIMYAVRSSGVNEDSAERAWAGVFLTKLNVSHQDLESAIFECIKAISSANVIAYADAHNKTVGGLAIIVQEMVDARRAGVLFTHDPTSGIHMIVESCEGTADRLVSGHVTPTRYYLDTETGAVVRREGSDEGDLTEQELAELFGTAQRLKTRAGKGLDIEWAFEKSGTLFVNQSRPITSLIQPVTAYAAITIRRTHDLLQNESVRLVRCGCPVTAADVLSNQNVAELLTENPSHMAHGLFCYLFADNDGAIKTGRNAMGYDIDDELNTGFHRLIGGKPRVSIVHDALTYRIRGIPKADYALIIEEYLRKIREDESLANYPEVALYQQRPTKEFEEFLVKKFGHEKAETYVHAYDSFFAGIRSIEDTLRQSVTGTFVPQWRNTIGNVRKIEDTLGSTSGAIALYQHMCDLLRTNACPVFVQVARLAFFAYARSRTLLVEHFGEQTGTAYHNTLTSIISTHSPDFMFKRALSELREGAMPYIVRKEFGHLAEHELEIALPRYREQPDLLAMLASSTEDPRERHFANAAAADQLAATLERTHPTLWQSLERELQMTRIYLELREVAKFEYLRGYEILRRLALRIEQDLGWSEGLIFNLDPTEVFRLNTEFDKLEQLAKQRAEERNLNRNLFVPPVLYGDRLADIGRAPSIPASGHLRGIGVTNEVADGICVVVTELTDTATLKLLGPGSILVTENTDPAWGPVIAALGKSGALVTEIGGLVAHTAICARELGIAAVLNVPNATKILKTGMRVRVDGPSGIVEILSES